MAVVVFDNVNCVSRVRTNSFRLHGRRQIILQALLATSVMVILLVRIPEAFTGSTNLQREGRLERESHGDTLATARLRRRQSVGDKESLMKEILQKPLISKALTGSISSNEMKRTVIDQLLAELKMATSPSDAEKLHRLLRRTWLFHDDASVTAMMRSGLDAMSSGDFQSAEQTFSMATQMDPAYAEAWNKLSTCQYELGDYMSSLANVRKTLELEPNHLGARMGLGLVLLKLQRFGDAAEAFQSSQDLQPNILDGNQARSWYANALNALRGAIIGISGAAPQVGKWTITCCVLASMLFTGAVQSTAPGGQLPFFTAGTWSSVLERPLAPPSSSPWNSYTTTNIQEMRSDKGNMVRLTKIEQTLALGAPLSELKDLVKGIRSNVAKEEVSARLLDELGVESNPARAAAISDLVWKSWIYHENPIVRSLMKEGINSMAAGDLQEAKWRFTNAAHFDPNYAEAWNKLATVYYLMGEQELSLSAIESTLEIEPRHFGAISGRGLVLLKLERFGEAASAFRDVKGPYPAAQETNTNVEFAEAMEAARR